MAEDLRSSNISKIVVHNYIEKVYQEDTLSVSDYSEVLSSDPYQILFWCLSGTIRFRVT